jgi:Transposase DDE domain
MMDLDSFLVSLYVQIDDWWKANHPSATRRPGRPALLSDSEVLTLAILAQWPRFRSERDFWRFASSHLRPYFPMLCSQGQLNRRVRALEPELRFLQRAFAEELSEPSAVYRVMDTTLISAIVRVRASRKGLFAGQASFGRSASKTEWVYGFKVALVVDPEGVITAFGLAGAASDERPIGDALVASDHHGAYLADKGFTGVEWERLWMEVYGALVAAAPKNNSRRAWSKADRRWASFARQTPDHRRGNRPTQGLLLFGAPSCQNAGRAVDAIGRQGRGIHLRSTDQRLPQPTVASAGGLAGLVHYTSVVLALDDARAHLFTRLGRR